MSRKKAVMMIFFLIIIVLCIAPSLMGIYAESYYKKHLTRLNDEKHIHITLTKYKRGWFCSRAVLNIKILNPHLLHLFNQIEADDHSIPTAYIVEQSIQHGPILYRHWKHITRLFGIADFHHIHKMHFQLGDSVVSIMGLDFDVFYKEYDAKFKAQIECVVSKILLNHTQIASFNFKVGVDHLNNVSMDELFKFYQMILERGELYQSQFKQKMAMMIPTLIMKGSSMQLSHLDLQTDYGDLQLAGKMQWDLETSALPDNLIELLRSAQGSLHVTIQKTLMNQWIDYAAAYYALSRISRELQMMYNVAHKDSLYAIQRNRLLILQLVYDNLLPENIAIQLLELQNQGVTLEEYQQEIQKLLLDKTIALWTNYDLFLLYLPVQMPWMNIATFIDQQTDQVKSQMQKQWMEWVREGYITQNHDYYFLSLTQDPKGIQVDHHVIYP